MRFHFRHVGYSAAFASTVATFGCAAALGATPTNLQELVAREVGGLIEQHILVGAAVGVVGMGEVHSYYLGRTKKGDGPVPGPDTLFEIGSITKVFTGTALASMQLDGTAKLDDPVKAYLPEGQAVPTFSGQEITPRKSCMPSSPGTPCAARRVRSMSIQTWAWGFWAMRSRAAPGKATTPSSSPASAARWAWPAPWSTPPRPTAPAWHRAMR